jgi:hypothetical protein
MIARYDPSVQIANFDSENFGSSSRNSTIAPLLLMMLVLICHGFPWFGCFPASRNVFFAGWRHVATYRHSNLACLERPRHQLSGALLVSFVYFCVFVAHIIFVFFVEELASLVPSLHAELCAYGAAEESIRARKHVGAQLLSGWREVVRPSTHDEAARWTAEGQHRRARPALEG